jgi:predicted Zn-dependent protease
MSELGFSDVAMDVYRAYLKYNPEDAKVMRRLESISVSGSGRNMIVDSATQDRPGASEELLKQGEVTYQQGDAEGARKIFERILQSQPKNIEAQNNLGVLLWETGDVQQALHYLTQALNQNPRHRETVLNCATVLNAAGYPGDAKELCESYLKNVSDDPEIREILHDAVSNRHQATG